MIDARASSICSLALASHACLRLQLACWMGSMIIYYMGGIGIPLVEDNLLLVVGLPKMTYFDRKGHSTKLFLSYFLIFNFRFFSSLFCSFPPRRKRYTTEIWISLKLLLLLEQRGSKQQAQAQATGFRFRPLPPSHRTIETARLR
jgi:hypothetical protein